MLGFYSFSDLKRLESNELFLITFEHYLVNFPETGRTELTR